ncbi:unnamed protein product, partial [Prorocentrum cordatum]
EFAPFVAEKEWLTYPNKEAKGDGVKQHRDTVVQHAALVATMRLKVDPNLSFGPKACDAAFTMIAKEKFPDLSSSQCS